MEANSALGDCWNGLVIVTAELLLCHPGLPVHFALRDQKAALDVMEILARPVHRYVCTPHPLLGSTFLFIREHCMAWHGMARTAWHGTARMAWHGTA